VPDETEPRQEPTSEHAPGGAEEPPTVEIGRQDPTEPVWFTPDEPPASPPIPPPPGGWAFPPVAPIPPAGEPRAPVSPWRKAAVIAVLVALVIGSGSLGAAIGVAVHDRSTSNSAGGFFPTLPPDQGSTPTTVAPTAGIDGAAVAAKVDPVVVDINTTLAGGGRAAGTGIVLTSNGLVLTNNHVIEDADSITAQVEGAGRTYTGRVVGYDVVDDVAVVQLQGASGLKTATLGNSSSLSVGTPVVAIGNALGQGGTPQESTGTITALNQTITVRGDISAGETLHGLIQFDAPIQSGDSGGPLVDANGRVEGMDTAAAFGGGFRSRLAPSDAGYAIPVNTAVSIAHQITGGKAAGNIHIGPRPLLGVEVGDVNSDSGGGFGGFGNGSAGAAPVSSGALVVGVNDGTPAADAGMVAGDVIVALGGETISDAASLSGAILHHKVGDTVRVEWVDQSGAHHTASVTFVAGPPA